MINSYNRIAPLYSLLAKTAYGSSIVDIQKVHFKHLKKQAKVLIVGGGDGEILLHLFRHSPHYHVHYLESSSGMIELSRAKNPFEKIDFIHGSSLPNHSYDIIILPFVLDCMPAKVMNDFFDECKAVCKEGAQIIVSDFNHLKSRRHRWLVKWNILFFRLVADHPVKVYYNIFEHLNKDKIKLLNTKTLKGELFRSELYLYSK